MKPTIFQFDSAVVRTFADLCREAAKHGAISFRMRNH